MSKDKIRKIVTIVLILLSFMVVLGTSYDFSFLGNNHHQGLEYFVLRVLILSTILLMCAMTYSALFKYYLKNFDTFNILKGILVGIVLTIYYITGSYCGRFLKDFVFDFKEFSNVALGSLVNIPIWGLFFYLYLRKEKLKEKQKPN